MGVDWSLGNTSDFLLKARDALKTSGAFLAISSPNLRVLIVSP